MLEPECWLLQLAVYRQPPTVHVREFPRVAIVLLASSIHLPSEPVTKYYLNNWNPLQQGTNAQFRCHWIIDKKSSQMKEKYGGQRSSVSLYVVFLTPQPVWFDASLKVLNDLSSHIF